MIKNIWARQYPIARLLYFFTLLLFVTTLLAETIKPVALSLEEAILLAQRHNANIKSAKLDRVVEKYNLRVAEYAFQWHLQVDGDASYTDEKSYSHDYGAAESQAKSLALTPSASLKTKYGTSYSFSFDNRTDGDTYNPIAEFNITQPLLRGANKEVINAPLTNSYNLESINRLALKIKVMQEMNRVIKDYITYAEALTRLDIDKRTLYDYQAVKSQTEIKIKAGELAESDIKQSIADIASQKVVILSDKNDVDNKRMVLLKDIGLPINLPIRIDRNIQLKKLDTPNYNGARLLLLKNSLLHQTNQMTLQADRLNYLKAKDDKRWQLDVNAVVTLGGGGGSNPNSGLESLVKGDNRAGHLNVALSVPLTKTELKRNIVAAKIQVEKDQVKIEQDKLELQTELLNQIRNIDIQRRQIILAEDAVKAAKQSVEVVKKQQAYGRSSPYQVSYAQNNFRQIQINLYQKRYAYLQSISQLQADLGLMLDVWGIQLRD